MTAPRAEGLLAKILPLESYRSLPVPTLRLGRPAVVGVAGPKRVADDGPAAPMYWFAVDLDADLLLAFARTDVTSPVEGGVWSTTTATAPDAMNFAEALAFVREHAPSIRTAFFAGQRLDPAVARQAWSAYSAVVAPRYAPWLRACCSDFFAWLEDSAS